MYLLGLVSRWAHILAAMVAVGGMTFHRFALLPAADTLPPDQRAAMLDATRSRWSKWVMGAIAFLLVSGLYNYLALIARAKAADFKLVPQYHMLFGLKFMLALAIFFLASVLNGRSSLAVRVRQNAKMWLNVNLALAITLVMISGVMRSLPHPPIIKTEVVRPVMDQP